MNRCLRWDNNSKIMSGLKLRASVVIIWSYTHELWCGAAAWWVFPIIGIYYGYAICIIITSSSIHTYFKTRIKNVRINFTRIKFWLVYFGTPLPIPPPCFSSLPWIFCVFLKFYGRICFITSLVTMNTNASHRNSGVHRIEERGKGRRWREIFFRYFLR